MTGVSGGTTQRVPKYGIFGGGIVSMAELATLSKGWG